MRNRSAALLLAATAVLGVPAASHAIIVTRVPTTQKIVGPEAVPPLEVGVIAFRVEAAGADTVTEVHALFKGRAGTPLDTATFDTVGVFIDANRNGELDPGVDTPQGPAVFDVPSGEWRLTGLSVAVPPPPDSAFFVVSVVVNSKVLDGETFQAQIPVGGVTATIGGTAPASPIFEPAIHGTVNIPEFTDTTFAFPALDYPTPDTAYIEVEDAGANKNPAVADTVTVTVTKDSGTPDTETVTLTEVAPASAVFRSTRPISNLLADSIAENGKIYALGGDLLRVTYTGTNGTFIDTVSIAVPPPPDTTPPAPFSLLAPANLTETNASTISFAWTASSDSSPPVTYVIRKSTSPTFATFFDSATGTATSGLISGFSEDTWYWRVIATDNVGNTTVSTPASRQFIVDVTAPPSPTLVDPTAGETKAAGSVLLDWNAVTDNLSGVANYRVQVDTTGTFGGPFVADGLQTAPDTTVTLGADTYFWRVIVRDDAGNSVTSPAESFVVFVPAETVPPSAFNLANPPAGHETTATSITFAWTASSDSSPPVSYRLQVATAGGSFAAPVVDVGGITGTSSTQALAACENYVWRVIASDANGNTTVSTPVSSGFKIDRCGPSPSTPSDPTAGETRSGSSVTFTWTAATDTQTAIGGYRVQVSTSAGFFTFDLFQAGGGTSLTINGFSTPDTYYWRVVSQDSLGNQTTGASDTFLLVTPPDTSPPLPVQNLAATANNNATITLTWSRSPSANMDPGGSYNVYWDNGTGTIDTVSVLANVAHTSATTYSFTTGTLTVGTTYSFIVRATNKFGIQNSDTTKVLATAQAAPPPVRATVVNPKAGASVLKNRSVFIAAELDTSVALTNYQSVTFQYRPDTTDPTAPFFDMAAGDTPVNGPNPATGIASSLVSIMWAWDTPGVFQARAVARNTAGQADSAPPIVTFSIVADETAATRTDTVIQEGSTITLDDGRTLVSDGLFTQTMEVIYGGTENTVIAGNETTTVEVTLPPEIQNVIGESDVLEVVTRPCNDSDQGRPEDRPGASYRVDLSLASDRDQFGNVFVTVTLTYQDEDGDGVVDGTDIQEDEIELWVYSNGGWSKVEPVTIDKEAHTVTGQVNHFSTFLLVGPASAATLQNATATPNPYRPNDGDPSNGRPFDGTPGSGIYFVNLTSSFKLEIFTISGARVASLTVPSSATSQVQWDVRNMDGRDVASGYYIWVVTDLRTGERKSGKLAIIR